MKFKDSHFKAIVALICIGSLALMSINIQSVFAADLTTLSDLMTRTKKSVASSHDITFTLDVGTDLDPAETVDIDFNEDTGGFAVAAGTAVGDLGFDDGTDRTIVDVDGDCTGHAGIDDIVATVNDTTGILTFEACGSFAPPGAGSTINVEYGTDAGGTNRVTNPGTAQNYLIDITAAGDIGKIAVDIEDEDQISVTAAVDPSITFTIDTTTFALGTLSTGSPTSSGTNQATVATNGANGYSLYVYDIGDGLGNPGLWNSAASNLIASVTADLGAVSGGYGFQCNNAVGDGACLAPYSSGANIVGGLLTTATAFATYGLKPSGTDTFDLKVIAEAPGSADAGSYTDTLTIISSAVY